LFTAYRVKKATALVVSQFEPAFEFDLMRSDHRQFLRRIYALAKRSKPILCEACSGNLAREFSGERCQGGDCSQS
jgi:hypothetical protein